MRQFIADAPAEAGVFAQLYGYCPFGADWERALLTDSGEQLVVIPRRNFKYRHEAPPAPGQSARQTALRQTEVRPIDAELALQIDRRFMRAISRNWGDPVRFRDMPADWLPRQVFAGNTYEHYRDHAADVRAWPDGQITV